MHRLAVRFIAPLLVLASLGSPALAQRSRASEGGMYSGNLYLFNRDVPIPAALPFQQSVVGIGYELDGRFGAGSRWGWGLTGYYGFGSWKEETSSGGASSSDELSLSHYGFRFGFDYTFDCCDDGFYCGPGFDFSSTKLTEKSTGSSDNELKPIYLYGLDARAGGAIPMGGRLRLFGETSEFMGYASYDETRAGIEEKLNGWYRNTTWRGGLKIRY